MKWPRLAAKSRHSVAEALVAITLALTQDHRAAPDQKLLRCALLAHAFNAASDARPVPPEIDKALAWAARASRPVAVLADPAIVRGVLDACALRADGRPLAATTARRRRQVPHNALGYAVETGLLPANPLHSLRWKPAQVAETVDRRSVASPGQARDLLRAVAAQGQRDAHMEAFFACMYYAALRPSEAVALHQADLHLPETGWGRIDPSGTQPRAGTEWTDDGAAREHRGLKHRAATSSFVARQLLSSRWPRPLGLGS